MSQGWSHVQSSQGLQESPEEPLCVWLAQPCGGQQRKAEDIGGGPSGGLATWGHREPSLGAWSPPTPPISEVLITFRSPNPETLHLGPLQIMY